MAACLTGSMAPVLRKTQEPLQERTLWVFPKEHPHGWTANRKLERIVFQYTVVPSELERMLPSRGYYRIALSDVDCDRIRLLAKMAVEINARPTELVSLQSHAILNEVSLMALREVKPRPLSADKIAHNKTERALAWYRENMSEHPGFREIADAVNVSPVHLRRLFHRALNESPKSAFNRLRMEMAEELLHSQQLELEEIAARVGFSSASALSRAMKAHFGVPPRDMRTH